MLEFLSGDSWINPQIDYLLLLQNIRQNTCPIFGDCFLYLTKFGETFLPTVMMAIVYWCFDLKAGVYLFTLNSCGLILAQFLKMAACIYRPWVLSDKIHPLQKAIRYAGGYSFPSGHCAMASTSWGGLAFLLGKKHKFKSMTLIILLILLVAFSRNFVGVHTPQDVLIGLLSGIVLIFVLNYIIDWCEKNTNRYLYLMIILNAVVLLLIHYVITKNYPIDYLNGDILVKPQRAIYISIIYCGWILGILNGAFLCRRFFPFNPKEMTIKQRLIIGVIGFILTAIVLHTVESQFLDSFQKSYTVTIFSLIPLGFTLTGFYPLIFRKFIK